MKLRFPSTYPTGECVLVPIDTALIPLISGAIADLLPSFRWRDDEYQAAYEAINGVLASMTALCASQLVQELRDFRGVMPAYASVPVDERTSDMYNSLNDLFAQLLEMRGIMSDGWFTDTYTSLKDVVQAMRGTNQSTAGTIWSAVRELLLGGSSIASIVDVVAGFLETQEQTAVEGGLLASLLAITAANTAALQAITIQNTALEIQVGSIISALRGADAPADNILEVLRGTNDVGETGSIVDLML